MPQHCSCAESALHAARPLRLLELSAPLSCVDLHLITGNQTKARLRGTDPAPHIFLSGGTECLNIRPALVP